MKPFVLKADSESVNFLLQQLIQLDTSKAVDSSVASSALTAVISAYPPAVRGHMPRGQTAEGFRSVRKEVLPRFISEKPISEKTGKSAKTISSGTVFGRQDTSTLEVLIEIIRVFGGLMESREVQGLLNFLFSVLEEPGSPSIARKLSIQGIAQLTIHLDSTALSGLVTTLINRFTNSHSSQEGRRDRIYLIGGIARVIPLRFGPQLKALGPFILSPVGAEEADDGTSDDEDASKRVDIRETSLLTLEILFSSCPTFMIEFVTESCETALRYIGYDPNMMSDDEDQSMDGTDADDHGNAGDEFDEIDEEDDEALADSDDESWKLRRASAKLLTAMITTPHASSVLRNGPLFGQVLSRLTDRLMEHEENVRIEIINTLKSLVAQVGLMRGLLPTTSPNRPIEQQSQQPNNRKRRRADSDLASSQKVPRPSSSTPKGALDGDIYQRLNDSCVRIVRRCVKIIKTAPINSKQSIFDLLTTLTIVDSPKMNELLKYFLEPVAETIRQYSSGTSARPGGGSGSSSASAGTLQRTALNCLTMTFGCCKATTVQPYLLKIVPILSIAIEDRFHKTSEDAILAAEQLIENVTTSPSVRQSSDASGALVELHSKLIARMNAGNADVAVRGRAIIALGVLYARIIDMGLQSPVSAQEREKVLWAFAGHLKSELLRTSVLTSLNRISLSATQSPSIPQGWIQVVALEVASHLRKSDAAMVRRNAIALRNLLCSSPALVILDAPSAEGLMSATLPLLSSNDMTVAKCALEILAALIATRCIDGSNPGLQDALAKLAASSLSGQQLDLLSTVYSAMGNTSGAKQLMQRTLAIGTEGDPLVIGRLSGTLLMSSEGNLGYRVADFVDEVGAAKDDLRQCLALAVVGTIGYLQRDVRDIKPDLFIPYFSSGSDRVALSAATAFGRAASSHLEEYTAVMYKSGVTKGSSEHHFLYSIKEIMSNSEVDITAFSDRFWDYILAASLTESNRTVAAECLGRLAASDPARFLPRIEELLKYTDAGKRGTAIAAIRFVLSDMDDTYDDHLRPILGPSVCQMLGDSELTNIRAALLTLHSAIRHTPHLLEPYLPKLMPLVLRQSVVHRNLIRQVSVGPFKIDVDDGLDTRRTAYESLFAIVSNPSLADASILLQIVPRIAAGFADDQDIRSQSNLMLQKVLVLDSSSIKPHAAQFEEAFRKVLTTKLKDSAVRQEVEAHEAACKLVCSATKRLSELLRNAGEPKWDAYIHWLRKDRPQWYAETFH